MPTGRPGRKSTATSTSTSPGPWQCSFVAEPPFRSAEDALRHAYHTIAKKEIGLRGTLGVGGGGELSPAEQMAQAAMIINVVRDKVGYPFDHAIQGAMRIAVDATSRDDKYYHLRELARLINCPNPRYKMHCLGAWSGAHRPDDRRWARRIGVTTRTLFRWRDGADGVTRQADHFLHVGLNIAKDLFEENGIL